MVRKRARISLPPTDRQCQHKNGAKQCALWALPGTNKCHSHTHKRPGGAGAPKGTRNRLTHGLRAKSLKPITSIADLLDDLLLRQAQVAYFLDKTIETENEPDINNVVTLASAHIANGLRISRVLRDQQELQQRAGQNEFTTTVYDALDELNQEVELDL